MAQKHCSLSEAVACASKNCGELREAYDQCFIHWYRSAFLDGKLSQESCTKEAWEKYRSCVLSELRRKGHERIADLEYSESSCTGT